MWARSGAAAMAVACLAAMATGVPAAAATAPHRPADPPVCNVRSYGAVGDNHTDDTGAIAKAISACASAHAQWSVAAAGVSHPPPRAQVVLPAGGLYLTKPLQLVSNIELVVESGATLVGWTDVATWPNSTFRTCEASPYESKHPIVLPKKESLVWASGASNVAVSGGGIIDGGGTRWWWRWADNNTNQYWHNCRPLSVDISSATNVVLRGFTIKDSPMFNIHCSSCDTVLIEGVTITTEESCGCAGYAKCPNTDGINLSGSNIIVRDSSVWNGDDCVPINAPSSNVTVTNITCNCGNGVVPIVWGKGGDITDVTFRDIKISNTNAAITIKSLPSFNGTVSNVLWDGVTMDTVAQGIYINAFGQGHPSAANVMTAHNITVRNVVGTSVGQAGHFDCGPAQPCTGITLENVTLQTSTQFTCENARGAYSDCSPAPKCLTSSVAN